MMMAARIRASAALCLIAAMLGAVGLPALHALVHAHEAHEAGQDLHELDRRWRDGLRGAGEHEYGGHEHHDGGHEPHGGHAGYELQRHHHHSHHRHHGDDPAGAPDPLQHGHDAPEHLDAAICGPTRIQPLLPPTPVLLPPEPLFAEGIVPRDQHRPNPVRGPPRPVTVAMTTRST